jgi:hypothetical protein
MIRSYQICPDFFSPTKPLPRRQAPLRWPLAQVEVTIQAALRAMNGQGTPAAMAEDVWRPFFLEKLVPK